MNEKNLLLFEVVTRLEVELSYSGDLVLKKPKAALKDVWGGIWDSPKMKLAYLDAELADVRNKDISFLRWVIESDLILIFVRSLMDGGLESLMLALERDYGWAFIEIEGFRDLIRQSASFALVEFLNEKHEGDKSKVKEALRSGFNREWISANDCQSFINIAYNQIVTS